MSVTYPQVTHQISGNTSGATALISSGTMLLAGGNNVTLSQNANSVTISAAPVPVLSAGTQVASTGTVLFANSNGLTFGMSGSSQVTASHNGLTSQSNQALSGSNGSFTFQTATFGNLNGMSFYTSNGSLVGSYSVPPTAGLISAINASAGTTSNNLSALTFADGNGVSFGLNGSTITASHNALTSQSNQAFSAAGGSSAFQTLVFTNSNGISFSNTNGSVWASHDGLTSQSGQAASAANGSFAFQTVSFSNVNGISFGTSAGSAITASHNALTSQSNQALSGSNGSFTFQTATFGNLNGLSFYSSNGSMVGSYTVPSVPSQTVESQTLGISNLGNTSGTSGVISGGQVQMLFAGGDNITLSQSINGASATITISGATAAAAPVNFSAGTTSSNIGSVVFSNSNGVSFGLNGATITARAHNTLSQFPSMPPSMATSSAYSGATTTVGGGSQSTLSFYISPLAIQDYITFNQVIAPMSATQSAGTYSQTFGAIWALYTNNAGTLSSVSSWGVGAVLSQNSATAYTQSWWWGSNSTSNSSSLGGNVSASFARLNMMLLGTGATVITPGQYWLGFAYSQSTNGGSIGWSRMAVSESQTTMGSMYGTNVSSRYVPMIGIASTTYSTNSAHQFYVPPAINSTAITGTGGSSQNQSNIIFFASV